MSKVYVVAAKRTAIGSFLGTLSPLKPGELGAKVVKNINRRNRNKILLILMKL